MDDYTKEELEDAFQYLENQLDDGYIDISTFQDGIAMYIIEELITRHKDEFINEKEND